MDHDSLAGAAASSGMLPKKSFSCQIKSLDEEGTFVLFAAVFDNVDRQGDVIEKGAFTNLDEFVRDGWIALNHDQKSLPVAYPLTAVQDDHGLKITGRFHSTPAAQACRTVVKERMAAEKGVKCSIGYRTVDESYGRIGERSVRRLEKLAIYEASFVNLPANPEAEVTDVKSLEEAMKDKPALETKRGRAISEANHKSLTEIAKKMDEHTKGLKDLHKSMRETVEEHKAFLKAHAPEDDPDDDGDDDEGESPADEEREAAERGKSHRAESQSDTVKRAYRDQLRERSIRGRRSVGRP